MAAKKKIVQNTFEQYLTERLEELKAQYIRGLIAAGIETVNYIRNRGAAESWMDQTGNLRSSVGFVIVDDGQVIYQSGFETVKEGSEGSRIGKEFSSSLAEKVEQFKKGLVLIVVAGMEYASYVEAMENKDVLVSSKPFANRIVKELIKELQK